MSRACASADCGGWGGVGAVATGQLGRRTSFPELPVTFWFVSASPTTPGGHVAAGGEQLWEPAALGRAGGREASARPAGRWGARGPGPGRTRRAAQTPAQAGAGGGEGPRARGRRRAGRKRKRAAARFRGGRGRGRRALVPGSVRGPFRIRPSVGESDCPIAPNAPPRQVQGGPAPVSSARPTAPPRMRAVVGVGVLGRAEGWGP